MNPNDPPLSTNYDLYPGYWYTILSARGAVPADELAIDFGTMGLYHYDCSTLRRINNSDPDCLATRDNRLVANFPSYGLYEYDGSTWTRLSPRVILRATFLVMSMSRAIWVSLEA
jgi:hypothetical protein